MEIDETPALVGTTEAQRDPKEILAERLQTQTLENADRFKKARPDELPQTAQKPRSKAKLSSVLDQADDTHTTHSSRLPWHSFGPTTASSQAMTRCRRPGTRRTSLQLFSRNSRRGDRPSQTSHCSRPTATAYPDSFNSRARSSLGLCCSRELQGPTTFDLRCECGAVFRAACIMLNVASAATLDRHREGRRRLMTPHTQPLNRCQDRRRTGPGGAVGHSGRTVPPASAYGLQRGSAVEVD